MGTRADFYIGRGKSAEWLGSVAWDGYPSGFPSTNGSPISPLTARTENDFRTWVAAELRREDGTKPEEGWPWPWEDSRTTDYAYAFDDGEVWGSCFGHAWFKATEPEPLDENGDMIGDKVAEFPNMKDRQKVTLGKRSGLLVFEATK